MAARRLRLALRLGPLGLAAVLAGASWLQPLPVLAGGPPPGPCSSVNVTTSSSQPVAPGSAVTVDAVAQCPAAAQYAFFLATAPAAGAGPNWVLKRGWGPGTFTLSTSAQMEDGNYLVLAWASDGAETTPQVEASAALSLLWPNACTAISTTLGAASGPPGTAAQLQATATCGATPVQYAYFASPAPAQGGAPKWQLVQGWTASATNQFQTVSWTPGAYWLLAWATDGPLVYPQVSQYSVYTVVAPPACGSATVAASLAAGVVGDPVTLSTIASCPGSNEIAYAYWYQPQGASSWTLAQGWTSSSGFIYDTSGWPAGNYNLMAWASSSWGVFQGVQAQAPFTLAASGGFIVGSIPNYQRQIYGEDCEEAALQMALEHEGIAATQAQILNKEGVDASVPGIGPGLSGDPYKTFVGPPNGAQGAAFEPGTYFPTVARAATDLGAHVLASGRGISPEQLYTDIENNHPVVVWVTTDFRYFQARTISAQGDQFPWAGPVEHAVLVIGIGANSVLVWNPEPTARPGLSYIGKSWVPMSTFVGTYATYGDMAVVLN
jgi:uncharacterized protein YvpB